MIALQVEILTGPNAGRKLLLRQTCVTFGRSADRTLPIDLPFISREHAEFLFEQGQWQLVNHSANGTRLNGKLVTTKPRPIKDTSTVRIGDTDIFRVTPMTDGAAPAADEVPADHDAATTSHAPDRPKAAGKSKLWIGIAVFWVVALGLIAFALLNPAGTSTTTGLSLPKAMTADQVRAVFTEPLPKQTPDARQADTALAEAREAYALVDRRNDALYRAFDAYRRALTYTPGDSFENAQDQRQFFIIQKRLSDRVAEQYESANALLFAHQFRAADQAFKDLRAFYPDPDSPIFKDALQREAAARKALP